MSANLNDTRSRSLLSSEDFERKVVEPWVIPPPAVLVSRPWWVRARDWLSDGYNAATALGLLILAGLAVIHILGWM